MQVVIALLASAWAAWGCGCAGLNTPCSRLNAAAAVFVADVTVGSERGRSEVLAEVEIVEALQNVPKGTGRVKIDTMSGTSCYAELKTGVRYLIITDATKYFVGTCSAPIPVRENEHIVAAVRRQIRGEAPELLGSTRESAGGIYAWEGIPGVKVELSRGERRWTSLSDSRGNYFLSGLEAGRYRIQVEKEGYVPDEESNRRPVWRQGESRSRPMISAAGEIEIEEKGCQMWDLLLWPNGSIGGRVSGLDGAAVEGVPVQVFRLDEKRGRDGAPLKTAMTDREGRYRVEPLGAGRYAVGVNANQFADESPYAPVLYEGGKAIRLETQGRVDGIDLVLPRKREAAVLRVKVMGPEGKAAAEATVQLESPEGLQRWSSASKTDENGELSVPAYMGEVYRVRARRFLDGQREFQVLEAVAPVRVGEKEVAVQLVLRAQP